MNNLNSILLEGIVSRDGITTTTPRNTKVCNFQIASDRYDRIGPDVVKSTSYFHIEIYGKLAGLGEALTKGIALRVVGYAKQDRWEDEYGKAHSRIKIVGEHVELRTKRNEEQEAAE